MLPHEINKAFRARLETGGAILMPGAANALAARVIADLGFEAVFLVEQRAGVWSRPLDLTDHISDAGHRVNHVDLAMAPNGETIVVYTQRDLNNDYQVFVAQYRGGVWTYPSSLTDFISFSGSSASLPSVAMYPNGDAIVVWVQTDGSNNQLFKSEFRTGVWTHPTNANDNISVAGSNVRQPHVACSANGEAVIGYTQSDGSRDRIMMSEYRNAVWTHPTVMTDAISPTPTTSSNADTLTVVMGDAGESLITWRQYNEGSPNRLQTYMSEYRNSTWAHPANLASHVSTAGQHVSNVAADMAPNGDALIVWEQYDGQTDAVFRSENRNGTWMHPTSLTDNITPDVIDCEQPTVAISNDGAVIAYTREYGSQESIYVTDLRNGSWRDAVRLAPLFSEHYTPVATMNAAGQAIVSWHGYSNWYDQLYFSYYR